jgi:hypothetical protein
LNADDAVADQEDQIKRSTLGHGPKYVHAEFDRGRDDLGLGDRALLVSRQIWQRPRRIARSAER